MNILSTDFISVDHTDFGASTLLGEDAKALKSPIPLVQPICHHGPCERLNPITAIPELHNPLTVIKAWNGEPNTVRAWSPPGLPPFELFPAQGQLLSLYNAGFTIVLENVEKYVPALRPLCRALEVDLRVPPGRINVEVFCALKGGIGRPHFDSSFTFNCQISGSKTWKLASNPALEYPPRGIGMFLGRAIPVEIDPYITGPMPHKIEEHLTFVAKPGSVVFVPPGALHETHMETDSFAVAFAIEATDCVASQIAHCLSTQLLSYPSLRAPRLGAQTVQLEKERALVVSALRKYAEVLEQGGSLWEVEIIHYCLPVGLKVSDGPDKNLTLQTATKQRIIPIADDLKSILLFASSRLSFSVVDLMTEGILRDDDLVHQCLAQLTRAGLLKTCNPLTSSLNGHDSPRSPEPTPSVP